MTYGACASCGSAREECECDKHTYSEAVCVECHPHPERGGPCLGKKEPTLEELNAEHYSRLRSNFLSRLRGNAPDLVIADEVHTDEPEVEVVEIPPSTAPVDEPALDWLRRVPRNVVFLEAREREIRLVLEYRDLERRREALAKQIRSHRERVENLVGVMWGAEKLREWKR